MGSSLSRGSLHLPSHPSCVCTVQGQGPYTAKIKKIEADILEEMKNVQELMGAFSAKHTTVARPCKRCTRTSLSDSPKPV